MKAATDKRRSLTLSVISLGLPILVSELGHIATGFADNIMVGRYATEALASASMVNNVFNIPYLACIGFAFGITPLVGMRFAQSNYKAVGSLLRNGIMVNLLFGLAVSAVMLVIYFCLDRLGQPNELLPIIRPYFIINILGIIPIALFNVFAQWSYGIKQTRIPMWITLISN
ncbi:MAG: MATE family efflux transporter, partial [Salinivirgaceae bacterium]|nr:MATE family efflux transporter [Salinivirgaceae bacterium]